MQQEAQPKYKWSVTLHIKRPTRTAAYTYTEEGVADTVEEFVEARKSLIFASNVMQIHIVCLGYNDGGSENELDMSEGRTVA